MNKILCYGELLMRMSPALQGKWIAQESMAVYIGGAELNVASALARWGLPVSYFTCLPENYLSREICLELQEKNIDTGPIHFCGDRIGIYFLPQGADLKHAGVIYDRSHSSFSELGPGEIDWEKVLKDISWFHFSAISPALGTRAAAVCLEAVEAASRLNIKISLDLNYRAKLWNYGIQPPAVMRKLAGYCDVIMGNIWSAASLLGMEVDPHIHERGNRNDFLEHARLTSLSLRESFPRCRAVANTFRFDHPRNGVLYYTALHLSGTDYHSPEYIVEKITDKVGTGDCFMAGLIYGFSQAHPPQQILDFATAAAVGKFSETGDATRQDVISIQQSIQHG